MRNVFCKECARPLSSLGLIVTVIAGARDSVRVIVGIRVCVRVTVSVSLGIELWYGYN